MAAFLLKLFLLGLGTFLFSAGALRAPAAAGAGTAFILENNCPYTVWPGALSGNGAVLLGNGSFELPPNATSSFSGPPGWSGRFWARTSCLFDSSSANGSCATGDCGGALRCSIGGAPPVSLAEFTLGGGDGAKDFYDVSLVDGYNVGIGVRPSGAAVGGSCRYAGCVADVNAQCPAELRVASESGETMACRSAVIRRHLPSPSPPFLLLLPRSHPWLCSPCRPPLPVFIAIFNPSSPVFLILAAASNSYPQPILRFVSRVTNSWS
ncbi:unnamed protein product [Musa acuminata var. zebrina]